MRPPLAFVCVLVAAVAIAAGCGDASKPGSADRSLSERQDPLLVLVTDLGADDRAALALLDGHLDVILVAEGACPEDRPVGSTCELSDLAERAATTTGRLTVIGAGSTASLIDLPPEVLERVALVTVTDTTSELAAAIDSVTLVPGDLNPSDLDPTTVAALIALDETIAAFQIDSSADRTRRIVSRLEPARIESVLAELGADDTAMADTTDGEQPIAAPPSPEILWQVEQDGGGSGIHSQAAADREAVYVMGFDGVFRAIDRLTGDIRWQREIGDGPAASVVALGDGVAVTAHRAIGPTVGRGPTALVALSLHDGTELWRIDYDESGFTGHPLVIDDTVFVWLADDLASGQFVALDSRTGKDRWRSDAPVGFGQPAEIDGTVYAGSTDGTMYGFDPGSGEITFRYEVTRAGSVGVGGIASRPVESDGVLYFGGDNGQLHAVDIETGDARWTFDQGLPDLPSSPVVFEDLVILGTFEPAVYALDRSSGEVVWRAGTEAFVLSDAALAAGTVIVGTGNQLDGFDARTGELRWRHETLEQVSDSPLVVDGVVYVQSLGRIEAVRVPPPP